MQKWISVLASKVVPWFSTVLADFLFFFNPSHIQWWFVTLCAAAHPAVSQKYTQGPLQSRLPAVFIAFNILNSIWSSFCSHPAAQACTHSPVRHTEYSMLFKNSLLTKANNIQPDQKGQGFQSASVIVICMRSRIWFSATGVILETTSFLGQTYFCCLFAQFLSPWTDTWLGYKD